jgi:hypothetical protein
MQQKFHNMARNRLRHAWQGLAHPHVTWQITASSRENSIGTGPHFFAVVSLGPTPPPSQAIAAPSLALCCSFFFLLSWHVYIIIIYSLLTLTDDRGAGMGEVPGDPIHVADSKL